MRRWMVVLVLGPVLLLGGAGWARAAVMEYGNENVLNSGAITSTSPATDFYTRMVIQLPAPDGNSYGLYFHPGAPG